MRFLQRLANADLAQDLEQRALRRRDERSTLAILEGPDVPQRVGTFLEQPLAMVLSGKALREPLREPPGLTAVEVQDRPLGHVMADPMPVERGLAADMQACGATLKEGNARVQGRGVVGAAIDAARQPLKPARPDVVDGQIGRYAEGGEIGGGCRRSGRKAIRWSTSTSMSSLRAR